MKSELPENDTKIGKNCQHFFLFLPFAGYATLREINPVSRKAVKPAKKIERPPTECRSPHVSKGVMRNLPNEKRPSKTAQPKIKQNRVELYYSENSVVSK